MTLTEYLVMRNGCVNKGKKKGEKPKAYLSPKEAEAFGIDMKAGWPKRYADLEIPTELSNKFFKRLMKSPYTAPRTKTRATAAILKESNVNGQHVYLMKNSFGLYKIGIAKDPFKRRSSLSTTSGIEVELVAFWKVDEKAYDVEQSLHREFKQYRKMGEWFEFNSYCITEIESKMTCNFERVYLN